MKMIKRYAGILMMLTLLVGFTLLRVKVKTRQNLICLASGILMKKLISGHIPGEEVRS